METFNYRVLASPSSQSSFRVLTAQFGDGYAQEAGDGINLKVDSWSISLMGRLGSEEYPLDEIKSFLDRHEGWKTFKWETPLKETKMFKCKSYNLTHVNGDIFTISATFNEVFVP